MNRCLRWARTASLFLFAAVVGWSQTDKAAITGTISDPAGSAVPNATVTATAIATGLKRAATTTDAGAYTISALPIGTYTVSIAAAGLAKT